jgi:predicted DNA-binding transcriptional regulator AlpA
LRDFFQLAAVCGCTPPRAANWSITMHTESVSPSSISTSGPERLDIDTLCKYVGGSRPLHPSTIYRMIKANKLPVPIKLGPKSNRWLKSQVDAALAKLASGGGVAA